MIDSLLLWAMMQNIMIVNVIERVTAHLDNVVLFIATLLHEVDEEPRIDKRFGGLYEVVDGFACWY